MTEATRVFGNIDRIWKDPATGTHVLAGWVSDAADPASRAVIVRLLEHGVVIGQAVADVPRNDGFHGFAARCDGLNLPARAVAGAIVAVGQAADGREGRLNWHAPFVENLAALPADDPLAQDKPVRPAMPTTSGPILGIRALQDGIEVAAGTVTLRITAPRDDIIRVRMAATPEWTEDVSWAVLDAARQASTPVRQVRDQDAAGFATARLIVRVLRVTGQLIITWADGTPVCEDAGDMPPALRSSGFSISKQRQAGEHYFGLGDQPGPLDRTGGSFILWNTDAGCYQESTSPMYKSVPFFMAVRSGGAYGILLDNSWRSRFEFGVNQRDMVSFGSEGGSADYYVLAGADPRAVLMAYAHLTGLPPLPPRWALGFQQCRFSYMSQDEVMAVADGLRSRRFPADVIYCDIDFQDRYRPFTTNTETFPDLPGMVDDLASRGLRTVLITDLHIAHVPHNYPPYRSGMEGGHFVHDAAGSVFIGASWPGPAMYPDFTKIGTRGWWGTLYEEFVAAGVAGFWNDMNEPVVDGGPQGTMPLDVVHQINEPGYPARTGSHAELHNVVGQQNARATYEALLKLRPGERPFVLTRASFAGGQRYGWSWTGDNNASWNHLRMTTPMLVNAGLSGLPFIGADVGGFFGSPPPALLTQWFKTATFHPLFRNHCYTESAPREPWLDGPEHEAIRRRFVEERYRLMPYLYGLAEEASRTGLPMMRPLFLECPSALDMRSHFNSEPNAQFMLGPALMVAPPLFGEMVSPYITVLPDGPWYDYWTGHNAPPGAISLSPSLEELPVFVRAGSIVPRHAVVQHTGEVPEGPLELAVYPGRLCAGMIYWDDGHSSEFQRGQFLQQSFTYTEAPTGAEFRMLKRKGLYQSWWKTIELVIHGLPGLPNRIAATRATILDTSYDRGRRAVRILLSDTDGPETVTFEM